MKKNYNQEREAVEMRYLDGLIDKKEYANRISEIDENEYYDKMAKNFQDMALEYSNPLIEEDSDLFDNNFER